MQDPRTERDSAGLIRKEVAARAAAHMQEVCETFVIVGMAADGNMVVAVQGNDNQLKNIQDKFLN